MKILIVEDSSAMRRVIINSLNKFLEGEYVEMSNGQEAMDLLKLEDDIDFVIVDWLLPSAIDGIELTKFIKTDERLKSIPVLMVTTKSNKEDIILAIRAGVNDYIVKPINPTLLERKFNHIMAKIENSNSQENNEDNSE